MPFRIGSASLCYSLRHHAKGSMLLLDYFNAYGIPTMKLSLTNCTVRSTFPLV